MKRMDMDHSINEKWSSCMKWERVYTLEPNDTYFILAEKVLISSDNGLSPVRCPPINKPVLKVFTWTGEIDL